MISYLTVVVVTFVLRHWQISSQTIELPVYMYTIYVNIKSLRDQIFACFTLFRVSTPYDICILYDIAWTSMNNTL